MTGNTDNSTDNSSTVDTNQSRPKASRNQILTAPLPDPITKNIEAIVALHNQEAGEMPTHQRVLENIVTFFGRAAFLYSLLVVLVLWICCSLFNEALAIDLPQFSWSQHGLDAAALLISTGVLIRQTRQENLAEQRSQLTLQLNLLSEQKIAKIIALLEELRSDLPDVYKRCDPEAEVMQEAADPIAVLEALEENLTQELSTKKDNLE
ncbi:MAG: DUF1003 domain-containing protein [Microcoleaceae cyanobacterium]